MAIDISTIGALEAYLKSRHLWLEVQCFHGTWRVTLLTISHRFAGRGEDKTLLAALQQAVIDAEAR